jgi:hypothetical protein
MTGVRATISGIGNAVAFRNQQRDLVEIVIAFVLLLLSTWTSGALQVLLWCVLTAFIAAVICLSFDGTESMGLRSTNLSQSLWVVGVAMAIAAVAVLSAIRLHTLHLPPSPILFVQHYGGYALWATMQQFLLQCFLLSRLLRLLPDAKSAAVIAAVMFAVTHLPSPILTPVTLIGGLAACALFLRYRNLYPIAMAHAILGIAMAVTIPGPVHHNMRVGLSYLTYASKPAELPQSLK